MIDLEQFDLIVQAIKDTAIESNIKTIGPVPKFTDIEIAEHAERSVG